MKHNVMKRTLAGVMAVLTVAAYMPANVGGFLTEGNGIGIVASADVTYENVSTAEAFKTAVEEGTSVKLTADINITETVSVTADVTIDLNGYNITATDARAIFVKSGSLILTGAGMISSTTSTPEFDDKNHFESTSSVIRVGENNTTEAAALNVGSSVIVSSDWCYGVTIFGKNNGKTVDISGTVSVTGKQCAVSGNGTAGYGGTTINIFEGATITAENDVAIYHPQAGTMNITGGTITGLGGIEAKAGTSNVSISGDNTVITATNGSLYHKANGNGTSTKGYAIVAVENSGYAGAPTFNITGGTINGAVDVLSDNEVSSDKEGVINITGGNFIINVSDDNYALKSDVTVDSLTIANGVEATIDLNGHDLILGVKNTDKPKSIRVNADATLNIINSKATGGTITATYQSDVEKNATLMIGQNVTLNSLANYALYYKGYSTVNVYGSVSAAGTGAAISGNGNNPTTNPDNNSYGATLNIYEGATVSCENNIGIYHPQEGTLNIYGGTISGKTALFARAGTVNIENGQFTGNGSVADPGTVANGADATGDAIVAHAFVDDYMTVPTFNISGGTFTSNSANAVGVYKRYEKNPFPTVSITGGYFSSDVSTYVAPGYYQDNGTVKSDERTDISKAKITVNYGGNSTSFHYGDVFEIIDEYGNYNLINVKLGDKTLNYGTDYEIYEGTTSASAVGTYSFKIKGINGYKGTAVGNWTISNEVNVSVNNSPYKTYSYGQAVTVKDYSGSDGYWLADYFDGQPKIVSYSPTYSFVAQKDVDLTWVASSVPEDVEKSVLTMSTSKSTYNNKDAIKFSFERSVDSKYTVQEIGILYGTNKLVGANTSEPDYANINLSDVHNESFGVPDLEKALTENTSGKVKKVVATNKNKNGVYELSYALGSNHTAYANAIGYVKVYDPATKKSTTIYSNVVATNYENA